MLETSQAIRDVTKRQHLWNRTSTCFVYDFSSLHIGHYGLQWIAPLTLITNCLGCLLDRCAQLALCGLQWSLKTPRTNNFWEPIQIDKLLGTHVNCETSWNVRCWEFPGWSLNKTQRDKNERGRLLRRITGLQNAKIVDWCFLKSRACGSWRRNDKTNLYDVCCASKSHFVSSDSRTQDSNSQDM